MLTEFFQMMIDIVFVHDNSLTWQYDSLAWRLWVDILPSCLKRTRSKTFTYDSTKTHSSYSGIEEAANDLLYVIDSWRGEAIKRPIVLVAHSFAGIIVKKALTLRLKEKVTSQLNQFTMAGIMFVGTPHGGTTVDWVETFHSFTNTTFGMQLGAQGTIPNITCGDIAQICNEFLNIAPFCRILNLYSTADCQRKVVDKRLFELGIPGERTFGIDVSDPIIPDYRKFMELLGEEVTYLAKELQFGDQYMMTEAPRSGLSLKDLPERHPGTCEWIIAKPEFQTWIDGQSMSILWLKGRPGSGKTVLASYVIQHLNETRGHDLAVYYFCDNRFCDRISLDDILRSFARQMMMHQRQSIPENLLPLLFANLHQSVDHCHDIKLKDLIWLLVKTLDVHQNVFFIVDGLDEFGAGFSQFLDEIDSWKLFPEFPAKIRFLLTTRSSSRRLWNHNLVEIDLIKEEQVVTDFADYAITQLQELIEVTDTNRQDIRTSAINELLASADNMYLWLDLMLAQSKMASVSTSTGLEVFLKTQPSHLIGIYTQALRCIRPIDLPTARKVFVWMLYSLRPLQLLELGPAIKFLDTEINAPRGRETLFFTREDVWRICGGLVKVAKDGRIHFVHSTVREFLQWEAKLHNSRGYCMEQAPAQDMIAKSCLKYLAFEEFHKHFDGENVPDFLRYVAVFWPTHYRYAETQSTTLAGFLQYLLEIEEPRRRIYQWTAGMAPSGLSESPLHLCSQLGFLDLARIYLEMGADPNAASNSCGRLPLHRAAIAANSSTDMVRILLERGANVDAKDAELMTPLHFAAHRGQFGLMKLLIRAGANVNAVSKTYGETPLHLAVTGANYEAVKLLIESGADVHATTRHGGETALHSAAAKGLYQIVIYLLERSSDKYKYITARRSDGRTASDLAAAHGHEAVEEALLDNIEEKDLACKQLQDEMFSAALNGLDIADNDGEQSSSMPAALGENDAENIELVPDRGVKESSQGKLCSNQMKQNTKEGQSQATQMSPKKGADINSQGGLHGNALQAASARGHHQIVQLLLDRGADINARGGLYGNALQAASAEGHYKVVRLLLDRGADINT